MTGGVGAGDKEDSGVVAHGSGISPGSVPTSAWCSSSSVGNTQFEFTWQIADYQRKKESIKRDDSIQSSTFNVQANGKKSKWYLTFLPNGAAEDEEDTDHDDHEDDSDITIHGDVAVYLYQVSAYEHYVNSLKFKISFLNQRSGEKMLVYDHGYGKKYRYHDSWGWGICDILVNNDYINDDTLTIICEMTIPGNDKTTIGYGFQQDLRNIKKEDEESSSKMITDMERLLESGTLTDVTIKCENRIIECHKAILSARSTVFRAMFQHDMRENKSNEILISDIDFCTVRDMVKFIYSGRLKDLADKSDLLLAAADKYDIKDLKNICCQHLAANLCVDQIVDILVLADIHKATELKNTAIAFLLGHKEEVFSQPDWKLKLKNHPDLLMEVLESTVDFKDSPIPPNKRRRRK